jgi:alpha-tubulin suppressor-like RCC1 family protein
MATGPDGNSHGQLGVKAELASSTSDSTGNIRWNDELRTITSLSSIPIAQIAAGLRSSYFRMPDGRVLGLGGNAFGQLGLGALASVEVVPIPSEVVLARSYPPGVTVKCVNIAAGKILSLLYPEPRCSQL